MTAVCVITMCHGSCKIVSSLCVTVVVSLCHHYVSPIHEIFTVETVTLSLELAKVKYEFQWKVRVLTSYCGLFTYCVLIYLRILATIWLVDSTWRVMSRYPLLINGARVPHFSMVHEIANRTTKRDHIFTAKFGASMIDLQCRPLSQSPFRYRNVGLVNRLLAKRYSRKLH